MLFLFHIFYVRMSMDAPKQEGEGGLDATQIGILQLNNMSYRKEPDIAVVVQRNSQSSFFLSSSYTPGSSMTAILNSGSSFINLRQSSLILDVRNTSKIAVGSTTGANAWFGVNGGSACNLIKRFQLISKSGVVLERIDNCNQLAATKVNYQYSKSWKESVGSLMGITQGDYFPVDATELKTVPPPAIAQLNWPGGTDTTGNTQRFIIPLYVFSTFCDSMGSLCPAQLMSGARVEILLESGPDALVSGYSTTSAADSSYLIVNCRLELESYLLTDAVMRAINQIAATQGLDVVTSTTQNTQSQRTSSQLVVDVAKSCSRALQVTYKERVPRGTASVANGYAPGSWFDPVASAALVPAGANSLAYANLPLEWQVRAGQLYFPQNSIRSQFTTTTAQADNELFMQTLRAFQKFNSGAMGQNASADTNVYQFRGRTLVAADTLVAQPGVFGGRAAFSLDLQRSSVLNSGIPLSNSRQLSITYNTTQAFVTSNTFNYLVDVFLTYQIIVRTFLSQAVLEV